jgi:ribonuclease HII
VVIPNFIYEKSIIPSSCRYLLGIDEVGRGPLAGPVTVAGFLIDLKNFDHSFFSKYIRDSKSLSVVQRETAFKKINFKKYSYSVFSASAAQIDHSGIQTAIFDLINKVIIGFQGQFDFVLVDGNYKLNLNVPYHSQIKADVNCFSVAAASICAKVVRDQLMVNYSQIYPQYGFDQNKGYGTATHLGALKEYGPCLIHRHSYKPVKSHF